ncbi:MAG: spore coat protein CotJB [Oscillospiraceae bacterium]|nr:spore coat protein CotJB [Oscillospiraceae bacterium]
MSREMLMKRINAYGLAVGDWNLYLDTHPDDRMGINQYHDNLKKLRSLVTEFEARFGPLSAAASTSMDRWDWVDDPWPWD